MNSVKKFSHFPFKSLEASWKQHGKLCRNNVLAGKIDIVRVATVTNSFRLQTPNFNFEKQMEQVVQLTSPDELKQNLGIDYFFAEKQGSQLIAIAATKKLLAEEKLRKDLQNANVPIQYIVRQHWRSKPSRLHPICPLTHEEL